MDKIARNLTQLFFAALLVLGLGGCFPAQQTLKVAPKEHKPTQIAYISHDTIGYDGCDQAHPLLRGAQYGVAETKEGHARLVSLEGGKQVADVWVETEALEPRPTYFLTLTTNAPKPKITIENQRYQPNMRLAEGNYTVHASAEGFIGKKLQIRIDSDTSKEIFLDFDIQAERIRRAKELEKIVYIEDRKSVV